MGVRAPTKQLKLMKKFFSIFMLGMIVCSFSAFAQLTIGSGGNVGIDANGALSRFSIGSVGSSNSKFSIYGNNTSSSQNALSVSQVVTTSGWSYGTNCSVLSGSSDAKAVGVRGSAYKSTAYTNGMSFGTLGIAGNAQSGYNYGVWGQLLGSNNGTAIFATVPGRAETLLNGMYAGYFRGNVYIEDKVGIKTTSPSYDLDVNGTIRCVSLTQTSDLGIKKDVKNLNKGLIDVTKLKGVTYKLKTAEELGLSKISMASDTGMVDLPINSISAEVANKEYTGFIAQDVQAIFPELVSEGSDGVLSVNYIGLIPVLVEAIKQQQAQIEELKSLIKK